MLPPDAHGQRAPSHSRSRRHPWLLPRHAPARMHTSVRREPSSAAIESARDSSTRALERTRPGERPPARGTARTIPRFSSMTPPSMHSSLLRILCICGTGCTSECQKDRLQHARRTTHTARRAAASEVDSAHRPTLLLHDSTEHALVVVAHPLHLRRMHKRVSKRSTSAREAHDPHGHRRQPGSRFHLDALCSEARRQSSLHDTCGPEAKLCRGDLCLREALPSLGREIGPRIAINAAANRGAKEAKRSKSARFMNSKKSKRSKKKQKCSL